MKSKFSWKAFWITVKAFAAGGVWASGLYLLYQISQPLALAVSIVGAVGGSMYLTYSWLKEKFKKFNEE